MEKRSIDVLVAEIGSTTTVVNAFDGVDGPCPVFLGQGQGRTTVEEGDVGVGLELALASLEEALGCSSLSWGHMLATSSAAGGLRMTVHGLVYDMTVRAAREAALGSGGVIKMITAGRLRRTDLKKVQDIAPNIIFLAGGTDYGERETALANFEALCEAVPGLPFIYAGNVENHEEIAMMAEEAGVEVHFTANVYPRLDALDIEPARATIHDVFEEHIVRSPGMGRVRDRVDGPIMPTPGAVMECAIIAQELLGPLVVVDIGGATTDVCSVCDDSPTVAEIMMDAEPFAKRTVEGDLGVFVNRVHVVEKFDEQEAARLIPRAEHFLAHASKIPTDPEEIEFVERLAQKACDVALDRHAGQFIDLYGPGGRTTLAKGKDLSLVRTVIGTGGALTRLPAGREILSRALASPGKRKLFPPPDATVLLDRDYIMASLGVLSRRHPVAARKLLLRSLGVDGA
ncbi:MAG: glutamate mutase L [Synergistaceae bacterium]|nr:glutamate mutase L [Synergistaceae bacterium]